MDYYLYIWLKPEYDNLSNLQQVVDILSKHNINHSMKWQFKADNLNDLKIGFYELYKLKWFIMAIDDINITQLRYK